MKIHGNVKDAKGLLENERLAQEARRRKEIAKIATTTPDSESESAVSESPQIDQTEEIKVETKTKKTRKKKDSESL